MKICYVSASTPRLYNLMSFMRDREHNVHWIALSSPNFKVSRITIHHDLKLYGKNFYKRNLMAFYYFLIFKKKIKKISPDILHAINIKWAGWFSVLSGWKNVIVTPQGSDVMLRSGFKNDIYHKFLRKYTLKRTDLVTYGNNAMLKDILFWALPKRTFKYFAGVDFNIMNFNIDSSKIREQLGILKQKVIFSPRTFDPNSNIDLIIRTIPIVKKHFDDVLYLFVCHQENSAYSDKIMALVEKLGVKKNCIFLKKIQPEEMPNFYSISDVVISILSSDGMPATLFEAMAMKKIMVLSTIPSYVELMDKKFAIMVDRLDSLTISDAIITGLTQPQEVADIKEAAYQWARKNADIKKLNTALEQIYYEMADNR